MHFFVVFLINIEVHSSNAVYTIIILTIAIEKILREVEKNVQKCGIFVVFLYMFLHRYIQHTPYLCAPRPPRTMNLKSVSAGGESETISI